MSMIIVVGVSSVIYGILRQFDSVSGRLLLIGVCFTELLFFIGVQRISFAYANLLVMAISYVYLFQKYKMIILKTNLLFHKIVLGFRHVANALHLESFLFWNLEIGFLWFENPHPEYNSNFRHE